MEKREAANYNLQCGEELGHEKQSLFAPSVAEETSSRAENGDAGCFCRAVCMRCQVSLKESEVHELFPKCLTGSGRDVDGYCISHKGRNMLWGVPVHGRDK
ncbi:low molecular weight phosphotyrosine protein phosphatase [Platysternon megacephalum]|uniref:Low molecular weight phosphotyrosine protein phosphatase n=1 Tax=Platysternon megacephalum TaxID=55544 RepID=A0A4D9E1S6_9SAUR|nr:low molecular weight phosphotyrosine protein phosphatase [Platysternon megacephalum]